MATPIWRRFLVWILDRGAEGVYQDQVISSSFGQWLKQKIPALVGGGAVTALVAWLVDNWIPACTSGAIVIVILIYAKAFINAHGSRHRQIVTESEKPKTNNSAMLDIGRQSDRTMEPTASTVRVKSPKIWDEANLGVALLSAGGGNSVQQELNSIGTVRDVRAHFIDTSKTYRFECVVDFHELGTPVEASPYQLLLTGPEGKPEIAILSTDNLPVGHGIVTYTGTARAGENWRSVWQCIRHKENGELEETYKSHELTLYIKVEIRVAHAQKIVHRKSGVKLDFELASWPTPEQAYHGFFVPITWDRSDADNSLSKKEVAGGLKPPG